MIRAVMSPSYHLERVQFVPRPIAEVFAFFARPENLETLTPDFLQFRILTPSPVPMHVGARIDYQLRLYGMPVRWASVIDEFEPDARFVDRQLLGPYRHWRHTHQFHQTDGGTQVVDRVEYQLPWGPIGKLAHLLFVRRSLDRIFEFRRQRIAALFSPGA